MVNEIKKLNVGQIKENIDLKKYTTYKVGGIGKILVLPENIEKLIKLLKYLDEKKIKHKVIGNGSNLIFLGDYNGVLIKLDNLNNISENTNKLKEEVFSLASKLEKQIKDGKNTYKIAYLTFDDGPYYLTNQFLDVLDKYNVKGTFFTIGLNKDICFDNTSQSCSGMYKKIVDRGHTIANHTYSHAIFRGLYSSADSFIYQVTLQENKIKDKTGVKTNIVRFPGGSATSGSLKNSIIAKLRSKGYGWVDWTAQDGDGGALANKAEAWKNFTNSINEDIEVVLFHDYNNITLSILPEAIEYLEKNNYIILPLFYDSVMVNK